MNETKQQFKQEEELYLIKNHIQNNPEVILVGIIGKGLDFTENVVDVSFAYNLDKYDVNFCVAPKKGLYTANELQDFMMKLIPEGLDPDTIIPFTQHNKESYLNFGRLTFSEVLGQKKTIVDIISSYKRMHNMEELKYGKKKIERTIDVISQIYVDVYPSKTYAKDVLNGIANENFVDQKFLAKYK